LEHKGTQHNYNNIFKTAYITSCTCTLQKAAQTCSNLFITSLQIIISVQSESL